MSRQNRHIRPPAPGITHRIHGLRSFTEVVSFGELSEAEPETPFLQKIFYTRANVLYKCDPDFTNHETVYTWAAETSWIGGIAIDHTNSLVYMTGIARNTIAAVAFDGTGFTESAALGNFFVVEKPTVDEARSLIYVAAPAGVVKLDTVTLGNITTLGGAYGSNGIDYHLALDKIAYMNDAAPDKIRTIDPDGTNDAQWKSEGAINGVAWDPAGTKIWWTNAASADVLYDAYPTAGGSVTFFNGTTGATSYHLAFDPFTGYLYAAIGDNATASRNGLFKFTDADQAATAHGLDADYSFGDTTRNGYGIALQFSANPQI